MLLRPADTTKTGPDKGFLWAATHLVQGVRHVLYFWSFILYYWRHWQRNRAAASQEFSGWHCLSFLWSYDPLCPGLGSRQSLPGFQGTSLLKTCAVGEKKRSLAKNRLTEVQKAQMAKGLWYTGFWDPIPSRILKRVFLFGLTWYQLSCMPVRCPCCRNVQPLTRGTRNALGVRSACSSTSASEHTAEVMRSVMQMRAGRKQSGFCKSNFWAGLNKEHCKSYPKYFLPVSDYVISMATNYAINQRSWLQVACEQKEMSY